MAKIVGYTPVTHLRCTCGRCGGIVDYTAAEAIMGNNQIRCPGCYFMIAVTGQVYAGMKEAVDFEKLNAYSRGLSKFLEGD